MNQWVVRIACFLLVCGPVGAGADMAGEATNRLYLGGQGGVTVAGFGGSGARANPSEEYLYGPGFAMGALAGLRLHERFGAQVELDFTFRWPSATIDGVPASTYRLSYIEMPVLGRAALPRLGRMEPYGVLGPSLGILVDGVVDQVGGPSIDITDRLERLDIGVVVGIGAAVALGQNGALSLEFRYNRGLTTWNKTTGADGEFLHRTFYFLAGYRADMTWL